MPSTQWGIPPGMTLERSSVPYSKVQNTTHSISPFCRCTASKWKRLIESPSLMIYGFQEGPSESTVQMFSSSPNRVATIQYLLPSRTTTTVQKPSESMWNGLIAPLLPIRDHSIFDFISGTSNVASYSDGRRD